MRGHASGAPVHVTKLDATVVGVDRRFDKQVLVPMQICWFPPDLYSAFAFRVHVTTRYELRTLIGPPPSAVRWFLNDVPLMNGEGSIPVHFESMSGYGGSAGDALGAYYGGGEAREDSDSLFLVSSLSSPRPRLPVNPLLVHGVLT